jgi:site-specific recombinase XerD
MPAQPPPDLENLVSSWKLAMQATRKSPHTVDSYLRGVRLYLEWSAANGHPPVLDRTQLQMWVQELTANGAEAATARTRQQAVRRYAVWLVSEDELDQDPFVGLQPPKLDKKVVDTFTDDDLRLLLKACAGKDFLARRDEAAVRLLLECGLRASELLALGTHDVDLGRGLVTVRRGKGGKGRQVAVGPQTSAALDRYVRARKSHRLAGSPNMFLGGGDQTLGYHGLRTALIHRAEQAGLADFRIHRLRHSFASRWLSRGGGESALMSAAGWSSRQMVDRYTAATAGERAQAEARRLGLGDL